MKNVNLNIEPLKNEINKNGELMLIAGPCSAETEEQVINTALKIDSIASGTKRVKIFRAGIWKPRTRPGSFEGVGEKGLKWLQRVQKETNMQSATEVAKAEHVEACLKHDIKILWIGARTSANPFAVQAIADVMKGVEGLTVMVKNPINPDLQLWIGALERINKAGIKNIAAIHRGVSSHEESIFRNFPAWSIPIELKTIVPNLPIIVDPSHIAGNCELIPFLCQKAIDLDMDGLMIETHIAPKIALSDAKQQLTPDGLEEVLNGLVLRSKTSQNQDFQNQLTDLRKKIDNLDVEVIEILSKRMKISQQIGEYKKANNVKILQQTRWEEIISGRVEIGKAMGLSEQFIKHILKEIHQESIRTQEKIMNS